MKIGRNEPCPCGSGKKYKKCCLNNDQQTKRMHSDHNGFIQPAPLEISQKRLPKALGTQIRPYILAKMCDPAEQQVQELYLDRPELKKWRPPLIAAVKSVVNGIKAVGPY
jgi:hypothetical protein